jgi:hypothetical protein
MARGLVPENRRDRLDGVALLAMVLRLAEGQLSHDVAVRQSLDVPQLEKLMEPALARTDRQGMVGIQFIDRGK